MNMRRKKKKKRKKRKQAGEERKNKMQGKNERDGKAVGECLREHRCPLDSACVVFYQGASLFKGGVL